MTQYLNIDDALARAKERSQGQATAADDEWLEELLSMSAGVDAEGLTHFRPYYASAQLLAQKLSAQTLESADGASFTGLAKPIAFLLALQAAYDAANALTIPPGFEALPPEPQRLRSRSLARSPRL